jgi:hypothetical protein
MRKPQRTGRKAVHRLLQYATMLAVAMTLPACASLERTGGTDTTAGGAAAVSYAEGSLPMCNAPDNREPGNEEESACTAADERQATIAIKVATKGVESGQTTFLCQCGDANLEALPQGARVAGELQGQSVTIISLNPTCLLWTNMGGQWFCTGGWI